MSIEYTALHESDEETEKLRNLLMGLFIKKIFRR